MTQSGIIRHPDQHDRSSKRTGTNWSVVASSVRSLPFISASVADGLQIQTWHTGIAHLGYVSGTTTVDSCLTIAPIRSAIYLLFNLNESVVCGFRSTGMHALDSQQHSLLTSPCDPLQVQCPANRSLGIVVVRLDADWLLSQGVNWTSSWGNQPPLTLTPRLLAVVHELIHGSMPAVYQSIYLNGKLMELLALQLDQQRQQTAAPSAFVMPDAMQAKMQQVRDLLLSNLATPPSLRELARRVGTNEFSLKQQFKAAFNTTVFNYLQQARMEKARQLLTAGDMKIAEVAHTLGYKHATHFTAAFKKHVGFLPNKIRLILLLLADDLPDFVGLLPN